MRGRRGRAACEAAGRGGRLGTDDERRRRRGTDDRCSARAGQITGALHENAFLNELAPSFSGFGNLFYRVALGQNLQLYPSAQFYYEKTQGEMLDGELTHEHALNDALLGPGLDVYYKSFSLNTSVQLPLFTATTDHPASAGRVVLALGVLAHGAVLRACGVPQTRLRFRHGAVAELPGGVLLADSYHVSRYNTNTGVLTREMFEAVVAGAKRLAYGSE